MAFYGGDKLKLCGLLFRIIIFLVFCEPSRSLNIVPHKLAVTEFTKHTLIKPKIYHGREKRQISSTKENDDLHIHELNIGYNIDGTDYILDLRLNRELIPKGYFEKHQNEGKHVINKPTGKDVELCQYQGSLRDVPNSWAALSTCHKGLSGVIYDGNEMHYVEKVNTTDDGFNSIDDLHYMFKHSDLTENNKTCGYQGTNSSYNNGDHHMFEKNEYNRILRYKRSSDSSMIRGPYNANKRSRYVELVMVVDRQEYNSLKSTVSPGDTLRRVNNRCKDIANVINALYAPLNIFVALVGVVVWTESDEIKLSHNGDDTLTNFLHYRRERLARDHPNDNAQLLTRVQFEGGVVGKALKGPICTYEFSGGVSMDHSSTVGLVATTIAHEMGHNFGMEHDNAECKCPDERCIMSPSSSSLSPTHWSSCSLEYLAHAFEHGMDYCLRNKPERLFDSPVCGNGFVEPGEQCDCGLVDNCQNTCCNASTCMLHSNASCATGECCDLTTCRPKTAGSICRTADFECDLPEYCTGQSEYCPPDVYKMDTETCDNGRAFCYQGACRTRTDQCKLLWGPSGSSSDDCYNLNIKGNRHGNCGYNRLNKSYIRCPDENVYCGMLHCRHLNEKLEFGMESVAILAYTFINSKGTIIPCRNAIVDLGLNEMDPGLTPDGAACGEGKMCINQKCMSVESLRRSNVATCPNDCSGNGFCNSKGHCHCKDGFAPPNCDYPGPGGSIDSGPSSDPDANREFVTVMYIVFCGIIPLCAIISIIVYYQRHNAIITWPKRSANKTISFKSHQRNTSNGGGANPFHSILPFNQQPIEISRIDDNSTLLPQTSPDTQGINNNFFGHFKGFSITPLDKEDKVPKTTAPPVPVVPVNVTPKPILSVKPISRVESVAPELPPLNPGSNPRPLISAPILENSTCTAKELISPLKHVTKPVRPAPEVPTERPLSTPNIQEVLKKSGSGSTLNRIASFLKPKEAAPKVTKVLNKEQLKNLEISNPIPQKDIEIPVTELDEAVKDKKNVVMRAQSMRTGVTPRPQLHSFGSMRQANTKRPTSIPCANRPKSPPPPRPPVTETKPEESQYDDCISSKLGNICEEITPTSGDNIYAVIEEHPKETSEYKAPKPVEQRTSNDSMGLLGEIVNEIQNRNFDSIYSTSTLARKKKEAEETYANTSVYSNMNSAVSTTSSGYLHPSAVNTPVTKPEPPKTVVTNPMSTFKGPDKPFASTLNRKPGPLAASFTKSRQVTPPNLRTPQKATPTRVAPTPKNLPKVVAKTNSPDVVSSCASSSTAKSPDVIRNSEKTKPKVVVAKQPSPSPTSKKTVKPAIVPKTVGKVAGVRSNVASLQQKFEATNKPNVNSKRTTKS